MGGDFGSDAVEGVEKEMGVELESDQLEFHLLDLSFGLQLLKSFLLNENFCFQPKIGERPCEVDKPHQQGKDGPALPDWDCLAKA